MLLLPLALMIFAACGGDAVDDSIYTAQRAMDDNDYDLAQQICDDLTEGEGTLEGLTAMQLGRLSILYLKLDERSGDGRNSAMATRCYRASYAADADSAHMFYNSLQPEEYALSETLRQIEPALDGVQYHQEIINDDTPEYMEAPADTDAATADDSAV